MKAEELRDWTVTRTYPAFRAQVLGVLTWMEFRQMVRDVLPTSPDLRALRRGARYMQLVGETPGRGGARRPPFTLPPSR